MCFSGSESCEEEPERTSGVLDELSHVGLPPHLNVQSLFESGKNRVNTSIGQYAVKDALLNAPFADPPGQCWAHQSCALWSEGVRQGEGQSLLNVDRAIYSGSTKVSGTSRVWTNGPS